MFIATMSCIGVTSKEMKGKSECLVQVRKDIIASMFDLPKAHAELMSVAYCNEGLGQTSLNHEVVDEMIDTWIDKNENPKYEDLIKVIAN